VEDKAPTVAAVVREKTGASWSRARKLCTDGRDTVDGERCLDPAARILPDAVVVVDEHAPKVEKGPLARDAIVFHDRDVVVVDKPAGMLSVADEPGNKETLVDYTRTLLRRIDKGGVDAPLGVVHRLDRDTSGLMMFTRTALAKRVMTEAFTEHDIERVYHAIAHGEVPEKRMESWFLLDRGDGLRGSHGHFRRAAGDPPADARLAITYAKPLAALEGATLVECRLETGRQHQIRIHLAELGHPLLGEFVYIRDYRGEKIEAPRTMLHARTLGFTHPRSGRPLTFTREAPADFQAMLESLAIPGKMP
jgi:23S rRNA pseudouridine1911/1915/1917 synthase